ncbi:MAG: hypothetical protein V4733_05940 [Verrucomicrobiota bacterium]
MKSPAAPVETLLALKRHETPPAGYWQDFLHEFHRTCGQNQTPKPARFQRVIGWAFATRTGKCACAAALVYGAVTLVFLVHRDAQVKPGTPVPVKFEMLPTPILELPKELKPVAPLRNRRDGEIF